MTLDEKDILDDIRQQALEDAREICENDENIQLEADAACEDEVKEIRDAAFAEAWDTAFEDAYNESLERLLIEYGENKAKNKVAVKKGCESCDNPEMCFDMTGGCPVCHKMKPYYRKKTDDYRCPHCGSIWPKVGQEKTLVREDNKRIIQDTGKSGMAGLGALFG